MAVGSIPPARVQALPDRGHVQGGCPNVMIEHVGPGGSLLGPRAGGRPPPLGGVTPP